MEHAPTLLVLAGLFGLFMAWGIGANDVANAMATSVGSRALTIRQAVLVAAVFEFTGAVLAGGAVTETIRKGIVDTQFVEHSPEMLIFGMLAALLAAATWLWIASRRGWPVSTTHSIVGAIVGFAIAGLGTGAVHWDKIGSIVMSWLVSPLSAAFVAFWLFRSVQWLILETADPFARAQRYVPVYIFITGFVIASITISKGLKHVGFEFARSHATGLAIASGLFAMAIGMVMIRRIRRAPERDADFHFANVERIFAVLMIFTACSMAFAHGSNDVANAVGPVAAIVSVIESGGLVGQKAPLPIWVLVLGAAGIVIGLMTFGQRVIATVGTGITDLTPSRGFCAELATAATVVIASGIGLPISTTHTLVGGILGVGLARGLPAINLQVVRGIFLSWLVTLPAGAVMAAAFFFVLRGVFS